MRLGDPAHRQAPGRHRHRAEPFLRGKGAAESPGKFRAVLHHLFLLDRRLRLSGKPGRRGLGLHQEQPRLGALHHQRLRRRLRHRRPWHSLRHARGRAFRTLAGRLAGRRHRGHPQRRPPCRGGRSGDQPLRRLRRRTGDPGRLGDQAHQRSCAHRPGQGLGDGLRRPADPGEAGQARRRLRHRQPAPAGRRRGGRQGKPCPGGHSHRLAWVSSRPGSAMLRRPRCRCWESSCSPPGCCSG